jgi:hemerythrin-like domain-containing protein
MQARGPLMIEHRLIEKMLILVNKGLIKIEKQEIVDPVFVDTVVDFIRIYADRTHHGKEEDILFRELEKKNMSDDNRRIMNELIEEHIFGRKITKELIEANDRYRRGDNSALSIITAKLGTLVEFYPKHIEKEDKVFFPASRAYLSKEEEQAMLKEFWEFDRKMIHEKYETLVQELKADCGMRIKTTRQRQMVIPERQG